MAQVSNDKLFEELLAVKGDVGKLIGNVEGYRDEVRAERLRAAATELAHDARLERAEGRIGKVEKNQAWYAGGGTVLGMLAGWLGLPHMKL